MINMKFGGMKLSMRFNFACRHRSYDQDCKFENSRWRMAAISKMVISQCLCHCSFDFDEIWFADVNFESEMS